MVGGGFLSSKMKRKEIDDINDDFSDFSLSSPARKIRRLDAELPPIMEEEEQEIPFAYEQLVTETLVSGGPVIEELPSEPANEERAIVLFKPFNNPALQPFSNFCVSVDSDMISGFKNQFLRSSNTSQLKSAEEEEATHRKNNNTAANESLAVVPWIPSQVTPTPAVEISQTEAPELMETTEMGEATMDIEVDNNSIVEQGHGYDFGAMRANEVAQQWQQQHCMLPQLHQNTSTPITWFQ